MSTVQTLRNRCELPDHIMANVLRKYFV